MVLYHHGSFSNQMNSDGVENNKSKTEKENLTNPGANGDIVKDYDTILKESAVLTTISGFLFGFLLNISINRPSEFSPEDSIILMLALFTIIFAVSFLSMPVHYHHLQYPYQNLEKFKQRSHRFIIFGLVPLFLTLYFGLLLGLKFGLRLGFEPLAIENWAYILAAVPFVFIYVFYRHRKQSGAFPISLSSLESWKGYTVS
jgi:Family of unknown function (DUF6328)